MDDLEQVLAALRRDYLAEAPSRIRELQKDAAALRAGEPDAVASLRTRFHRLAGSGGSYGFPEVSAIAREMEQWLNNTPSVGPDDADRVDQAIGRIGEAFDRHAEPAPPAGNRLRVADFSWQALVVAQAGPDRDKLVGMLESAGFDVHAREDAPLPGELPPSERPDLVVIGPGGDGEDLLPAAANWAARRDTRPRAVVLVEASPAADRLRALATGVDAVFGTDQMAAELFSFVKLLARVGAPPASVLLVEDDIEQAQLMTTWLELSNVRVTHATTAMAAQEVLARELPDLIILDVALPEVDGFAFARMVRQDSRFTLLPVVFITARAGLAEHLEALRSGADDFLTKPVDQQLLLQVVATRIERGRRIREMAHRDGLTGLLNHSTLMVELAYAVEYAKRSKEGFAFMMVDLDHFKRINDRYGHAVGDQVLLHAAGLFHATARASDLIGRYGGEEFGLILRRASREGARVLAEKLRHALQANPARLPGGVEIPVRASFGIAVYPDDGLTAGDLAIAADAALYRAKRGGRDRVEGAA